MKKLIIIIATLLLAIFALKGQEYQYEGEVNGREGTFLLHFVTSSDDGGAIWSHGSYYFNDEGIANVVFQYSPTLPNGQELSFYMLPTNLKRVDNITGTVTKQDFTGRYYQNGKSFPLDLKTKKDQDLIIFNYYRDKDNKNGKTFKYFGKFISQDNQEAMYKMTSYLSENGQRTMPRVYLQHIFDRMLPEFETAESDWIYNVAIYPVVATSSRIVYRLTYYLKKGDVEDMNHTTFLTYDTTRNKIIDAVNFFKPGSDSQIEQIINTEAQALGDSHISELKNTHLPYNSNFYLAEKGVVFFYPHVPLENGQVENFQVFVSYDKLAPVMQ